MSPGSDAPKSFPFLLAASFLVAHAAAGVSAALDKSPVFDEVVYAPAGYGYLRTGVLGKSREHPPAGKLLVGLPLLVLGPRLDRAEFLEKPDPGFEFGRRFLSGESKSGLLLLAARLPVLLLSAVAGWVLFLWARRRIGPRGALLCLGLYALDPNLLAHGSLATLDSPLTSWTLLAAAAFDAHLESGRRRSLLAAGICLGLAIGTKIPGLLLVPVLVVLAIRRGRLRSALSACLLAAGTLLALYLPFGEPLAFFEALGHPFVRPVQTQPLPEPYPVFFWGRYSTEGFYLYYLGAMALKTPLPTMALVGLGAAVALRGGRRDLALLTLLPAALIVGAASVARRDVGLRYVLPAYPFLFLLAGTCANGARGARVAAALGSAWLAFGTWRAWPDFIPYFNEAAGGARGGIRFLDDSNVDWGQDVDSLFLWHAGEAPPESRFLLFTSAELPALPGAEYGLEAGEVLWPREGVRYAISAHLLQRPDLGMAGLRGLRFRWLERFEPERTFGDSIYLYRLRLGDGTGGTVRRLEWLEGGARQAEEVLARHPPGDPATAALRMGLAAALRETGRLQEAEGRGDAAALSRARAEELERSAGRPAGR